MFATVSGRLVLDSGTALDGENSYIYALRNGDIEISFADGLSRGAHFIDIHVPDDRRYGVPIESVDQHQCRLETYHATFRIENDAQFSMIYVVNGPAKAYISRSVYQLIKAT